MVNKLFMEDLLEDDLSYSEDSEKQGEKVEEPKADSGIASVLKSTERMLKVSNNPDLLQSLLDVLDLNTGISENPDQIEQLNKLKGLIIKKLDSDKNVRQEITENAEVGVTASCWCCSRSARFKEEETYPPQTS